MLLSILILIHLRISIASTDGFSAFDYYKNDWLENLQIADQWKPPTENSEFKNISQDYCTPLKKAYDFVIVGGGTAGSVMANRLSSKSHQRVLVLEAGGNETLFSMIPGSYFLSMRSNRNWGYVTVPQANACHQMPNRQCPLPRGKSLGGESALRVVAYVRGNERDFETWPGNWPKVAKKYMKLLENVTSLNLNEEDQQYRGTSGPFYIEFPVNDGPLSEEIYKAHEQLNLPSLTDYNGKTQIGVGNVQAFTKHGERYSTNQAYLQPIINRPNLKVKTHALATKIHFKKKRTLTAEKLEFLHEGACYIVTIKKELILTAGSFNTPQLLMLSGIGPKEELRKHKIPVIYDLPQVGKNLIDYIGLRDFTIRMNKTYHYGTFDDELKKYLNDRSGSLAEPVMRQISFVNTTDSTSSHPDFELKFTQTNPQLFYPLSNLEEPVTANEISAQMLLLHPESRGSVRLQSNDPADYPIIDPQYLQSKKDMQAMLRIMDFLQKLIDTPSFKQINATMVDLVPAVCRDLNLKEDDEELLKCVVRHSTAPMYYSVGTCRMGTNKSNSVVNPRLLVRGTRNVRIVDGSVFPKSTSGHTIPVIIMIAEAISDYINYYI